MFDTLLLLPLFQGLTIEDLTEIIEKAKLNFVKHKPKALFIESEQPCKDLTFVLRGTFSKTTTEKDGLYSVIETIEGPYLIEPQSLYGMTTHYTSSYTAIDEVHTVSISKAFINTLLMQYDIFRINYINIVCNRSQTLNNYIWSTIDNSLDARIAHFINIHCERKSGEKTIKIKMDDLANILNDTRTNISRILNNLQNKGVVELRRGEIFIFDLGILNQTIEELKSK